MKHVMDHPSARHSIAPDPIDYTALGGPALLQALGDDAQKWAEAFHQMAIKLGYSDMDKGWLIGWFANAIEHSWVIRTYGKAKKTKA